MRSIITVENLSKEYRIGTRGASYGTLRDSLVRGIRAPFSKRQSKGRKGAETIWALKDVSFEVKPGEVVGIIGRNGAGKSTLLKVLSRIVEPTTGNVKLFGRVGSLLEVGTGFHPELSGRENIYLNGAILGMKRAEIEGKFDEIVAFAEIEKFIDTPVKHYSSGMYMRLAFGVAAHLEPEILIVDEVLAVGDASFQKKCLGKMNDVAQKGRTVLFVSHNLTALQSICRRAIWLNNGEMADDGDANHVVTRYLSTTANTVLEQTWKDAHSAPGNDEVKLRSVRVLTDSLAAEPHITVRTPIKLEFEFWNYEANTSLNICCILYNQENVCVLDARSDPKEYPVGMVREVCYIPGDLLNDETYRIRIAIIKDTSIMLLDKDNVAMFEVHDVERQGNWYGKWMGVVRPKFKWVTELADTSLDTHNL
jgi:lipopolysaccharide transport system ATP-binding protein